MQQRIKKNNLWVFAAPLCPPTCCHTAYCCCGACPAPSVVRSVGTRLPRKPGTAGGGAGSNITSPALSSLLLRAAAPRSTPPAPGRGWSCATAFCAPTTAPRANTCAAAARPPVPRPSPPRRTHSPNGTLPCQEPRPPTLQTVFVRAGHLRPGREQRPRRHAAQRHLCSQQAQRRARFCPKSLPTRHAKRRTLAL